MNDDANGCKKGGTGFRTSLHFSNVRFFLQDNVRCPHGLGALAALDRASVARAGWQSGGDRKEGECEGSEDSETREHLVGLK